MKQRKIYYAVRIGSFMEKGIGVRYCYAIHLKETQSNKQYAFIGYTASLINFTLV